MRGPSTTPIPAKQLPDSRTGKAPSAIALWTALETEPDQLECGPGLAGTASISEVLLQLDRLDADLGASLRQGLLGTRLEQPLRAAPHPHAQRADLIGNGQQADLGHPSPLDAGCARRSL